MLVNHTARVHRVPKEDFFVSRPHKTRRDHVARRRRRRPPHAETRARRAFDTGTRLRLEVRPRRSPWTPPFATLSASAFGHPRPVNGTRARPPKRRARGGFPRAGHGTRDEPTRGVLCPVGTPRTRRRVASRSALPPAPSRARNRVGARPAFDPTSIRASRRRQERLLTFPFFRIFVDAHYDANERLTRMRSAFFFKQRLRRGRLRVRPRGRVARVLRRRR